MFEKIANWNTQAGIDRIGFYFHIPFCPHICPYCDFIKTSRFSKNDVNAFLKSCVEQLDSLFYLIPEQVLSATVYFGGGTPGLLPASFFVPLIQKIKSTFSIAEITIETNPYTNLQRQLQGYKEAGVTRITLGAQSLCPNTLKTLGRKHTPQDILQTIQWAKDAGIETIQADLIYGLREDIRTISLEEEVDILAKKGVTGISAYALTIEARTQFAHSNCASDERAALEYEQLLAACQKAGFAQLETSNFSCHPSWHNHIYWLGYPYLGIGTGAHGLLPPTPEFPFGRRYKVGPTPQEYAPGDDKLLFADSKEAEKLFTLIFEEPRTQQQYLEEMIFTLLRTPYGIAQEWLTQVTGKADIFKKLLRHPKIQRGIKEQKLQLHGDTLTLSPVEKIRGDTWAADIIFMLSNENL